MPLNLRSLSVSLLGVVLVFASACGEAPQPSPQKRSTKAPVVSRPPAPASTPALPAPEPVVVKVPAPVPASAPTAKDAPVPAPVALPESFAERVALGKERAREGKPDEAIAAFLGALALEESAVPHVEIARVLLTRKDARTARKHAEQAVALAPTSSAAWNTLGRVALMEKEYQEAVEHFTRATEANEANLYAWNNLGLALMQMGRWDDAIKALETATSGENPEPYMWNNLGTAYERQDRLEEARIAFVQGAEAGSHLAGKNLARLTRKSISVAKAEGESAEE